MYVRTHAHPHTHTKLEHKLISAKAVYIYKYIYISIHHDSHSPLCSCVCACTETKTNLYTYLDTLTCKPYNANLQLQHKQIRATSILEIVAQRWGVGSALACLSCCLVSTLLNTILSIKACCVVLFALSGIDIFGCAMILPFVIMIYTARGMPSYMRGDNFSCFFVFSYA